MMNDQELQIRCGEIYAHVLLSAALIAPTFDPPLSLDQIMEMADTLYARVQAKGRETMMQMNHPYPVNR